MRRPGFSTGCYARDVAGETISDCGHFLPEERPEVVVRHVQALSARIPKP